MKLICQQINCPHCFYDRDFYRCNKMPVPGSPTNEFFNVALEGGSQDYVLDEITGKWKFTNSYEPQCPNWGRLKVIVELNNL